MDQRHVGCEIGEEEGFLHRGIATADDRDPQKNDPATIRKKVKKIVTDSQPVPKIVAAEAV
jgi:hypothetical protein